MLLTCSFLLWGFPADAKAWDALETMETESGSMCVCVCVCVCVCDGGSKVFVLCLEKLLPLGPREKDYPETKLYSFLEHSLQGLNKKPHLA